MRMRRFLAFVLAVVMLMSNTVTASATSSSSIPEGENLNVIQNEDGSYTISPTEVDDEDDESTDEDLDNPSGEDEQEPNGDGTGDEPGEGSDDESSDGSGDESDDGSGDEGDNPNGGDNDDTTPGEDGGDVDDPNGEGEDGDDPLNPEEGEGNITEETTAEETTTEELTTEEPLTEEVVLQALEMLLEEVSTEVEGDEIRDEGENVQINLNDGSFRYYKSIGGAIDGIDELEATNPGNAYCIQLLEFENEDGFAVSDADLVSDNNAEIELVLVQPLTVEAGDTSIAKANIKIYAVPDTEACINVEEGVTLQFVKNADDYYVDGLAFNFVENDSDSTIIIGEEGDEADSYSTMMFFENVDINNLENMIIYNGFEYNGTHSSSDEFMVGNLTVNLPKSGAFHKTADFRSVDVVADTMEVNGRLLVRNWTVNDSLTVVAGNEITIYDTASLNDLTVSAGQGGEESVLIDLITSYDGEQEDTPLIGVGSLKLSGKLTADARLEINKFSQVLGEYGYVYSSKNIPYESGDMVAKVAYGEEIDDKESFTNMNYYGLNVPDVGMWHLEYGEQDLDGSYPLMIAETVVNVLIDTTGDDEPDEERSFSSLDAAKEYIITRNSGETKYDINIYSDITVSNSDTLDFSKVLGRFISLNLHGNTVKITGEEAVIAVDYINGCCYDENGNEISGSYSDISLSEGTTLTISSRVADEKGYYWTGSDAIRIISNASNVKIGRESDWATSEAHMGITFVNEVKSMDLYGRINIESTSTTNVVNNLYVHNVSDSENDNWQEAYITNMTVKYLYATEGNVGFDKGNVSDTLYLKAGQNFSVKAGGSAEIKNIEVWANEEDEYACASFELERTMQLAADDDRENPSFEGATEKVKTSTIKITGTVDFANDVQPIVVRKLKGWEFVTGEGDDAQYHYYSRIEEFANGETIVTATGTTDPVSPEAFRIEGNYRFVQRSGNYLKAAGAVLRVIYEGEDWKEVMYTSFEEAAKNMPTDFDKANGRYVFQLLNDTKLTADVTIPSFVEELIFETEPWGYEGQLTDEEGKPAVDEEGNPVIGWIPDHETRYQKILDLNGKKISTSAGIRMYGGVRIRSGIATAGKLVSTYNECALEIIEQYTFKNEDGEEVERDFVLNNVLVTAANGGVNLVAEDNADHVMNASFKARGFFVDNGRWIIDGEGYVESTDFGINGSEDEENRPFLNVSKIVLKDGDARIDGIVETSSFTVTNGNVNVNRYADLSTRWTQNENGEDVRIPLNITLSNSRLCVMEHLYVNNITLKDKSRLEVQGFVELEDTLSMAASKLFICGCEECYGGARIGSIAVETAYAAESMGDYTVENCGNLSVGNMTMKAGAFINHGLVEAKNISSVKDVDNYGSLICDVFKNTGKMYLGRDSHILINTSGTLNNVNVGDRNGDNGDALVGKSQNATVTFTGTFIKNSEEQQLLAFVTDEYKGAYADTFANNEEHDWDWITLSNDNGTPENWEDDYDADYVVELGEGDLLFNTTISSFPVAAIRVLPWTVLPEGEEKRIDNINNAVYQEGNALKVIGEYINIYAELPNYEWSHLRSFTHWKDASAYLNTLNSKTTTYIVEIKENIDLGQTLDLPANVKQIVFCSGKGSGEGINWTPEKVRVTFQGDITLKTDTSFENIILDAYTLDKQKQPVDEYQPTIDTKGKFFAMRSVEFADGGIKALKGTSSYVHFVDMEANIASKVSGIHEMVLTDGVDLVISGGLSVNNLIIDRFWDKEDAPDPCSVRVNGSSSTLEVKKLLEMRGQTSLICDGKMKFVDVISNVEGNIFSTAGDESIIITGAVRSDNMSMQYLDTYFEEKVDSEGNPFEIRGFVKAESETDYQIMKNAIHILAGTTPWGDTPESITVVTAEKVSPIWFVIQNPGYFGEATEEVVCANLVHKDGKNHISGLAKTEDTDIVLYAMFGENQMYLNSFGTLQDAFTEIDKIGGPDIRFKIEVTADDEAIVKGKLGNYTFPSKAAEVQIVGATGAESISYKNGITLKSNVVFANVNLVPSAKGSISIGNYRAVFENVTIDGSVKTSISGSGTNKGSWVTIAGATPMHITGDLTNVETLVLGETDVQVDGKISAGTLILPEDEVLTCLGTIAIGDVYTESGTIQTIPVYTKNILKTEITKVSSNLTISGDVLEMPSEESISPQLTITFVEVNNGEITGAVDLEDEELNGLMGLVETDKAGITIAKAVNVDTDAIVFGNAIVEVDENGKASTIGTIYKKAGTLVYKCSDPVILLQYVDNSGSEVETLCESFADAVIEINNLKTKRDYTMGIYDSVFNAGTLTMPNAKYVDTLTICPMDCARAEIQYMNNITFTSNVVLENIDFVQIVKNGKDEDGNTKYDPVDEVKAEAGAYPAAVSVSVSGAYFLSIANDLEKGVENNKVTFNTPIALNGNKKAILNIGEGGTLQTLDVGSNFDPWAEKTSLVQGKITGFAEMNVFSPISLYGYSSLNSKKVETYNATELNVTNLGVSNGAAVVVGQDALNSGDKVTVTNLNITDGTLETSGTGTFTNVVLGDGVDKLAVYGQTFNINGNLTSLTSDAELVTGLSKKSESALYVKGNVVLGDAATDVICVNVTENGNDPYILGQTTAEDEKNSTLLLKAKIAGVDAFIPYSACVLDDNEYVPSSPNGGYILKKTGESIQVYYGKEIGVALCDSSAENGEITEVINYYPTYNDAVAAIEALKDTEAEYTIVVIQPVGTEGSPVALSMPSKAAKVTVVGYAGNAEKEVIYYTNAPSLKTSMVFANVTLAPEKVSKKVVSPAKLGITTGNFDITLQDIEVTGENAGIAKITGKNTATIKLDSEGLVINGDISAAKEVIVAKNATVTGNVTADMATVVAGKTVTVDSKFTAKALKLNGVSVVDAQKAAVTITDITSIGDNNKIVYGQDAKFNPLLTIKGNVENAASPITLDMKAAELKTLDTTTNPAKITLAKEAKWATVEKESLNKVAFELNGTKYDSSNYCWANKGVYRIASEAFTPIQIKDAQDNVIIYCLDFAQAVNYINTASESGMDYVVDLTYGGRNSVDVNLTDDKTAGKSAITMPGKDKAESVKVLGLNNGGTKIAFSGNVATYGDVTFENIWLLNDNASNFTIANKKDSDQDSSLTLIDTAANGKAVIKSISGEKGITDIAIRIEEGGIYPSESYGAVSNAESVNISNSANVITFTGMSAIDNLTIAESKLHTIGKVTVGTLNLQTNAAWEAKAAATVTTIAESKAGAYIGTFHSLDKKGVSTGLPQFTVTGTVTEPIQVKLFNTKVTDANGEWLEIKEAAGAEGFATWNAKVKYAIDYANQKLVLAKAESADKFIAADYGQWNGNVFEFTNPGSEQAYKDKNGYVSNGNISAMEVLLSQLDGNGDEIDTTYVATYAEAIQVINNLNNKDASYKISLRNTTLEGAENGNEGVIKTALSGTKAAYGTLALPAAKKAAAITIFGASDNMVMKYTSGLKPNCDVTFENITLTEGSLDKKGNYTALNYITPNLDADVTLTFAGNVKTLDAENIDLVFNKISGKKGEIAFATNYDIESKGAVSIADISSDDNVRINIHTYFTNKAWKKAATQLSINGDVQLGEGSIINVIPHVYDAATKTYDVISDAQMTEMLISSSATPASWQKVITAPKMQTMDGKITLCENENWRPVKYNGGVYFTNEELPVVLRGGTIESVPDQGDYRVEYTEDYAAQFLTWEEAIKEIDRINVKKTYTIELHGDLGTETPIKTLTMPSKASELIVLGIEDANGESPDIMMTGTTVTAKCNLAFDNVGITAVKKTGNNYYSVPFTLNTGNYEVEITNMPDMCRFFVNNGEWAEERGLYDSEMKVTGSAKGSFTYTPCEVWYDADESGFVLEETDEGPIIVGGPNNDVDIISQISKVGNITLNTGSIAAARWDEDGNLVDDPIYAAYHDTNYYIPNGISGVNSFVIASDVIVDCAKTDFNVKDLLMGNPEYDENGNWTTNENSDVSGLSARNITVSGLLTMASSWMHAGTSTVGDGKVTLTNVIFQDNHNTIEGKQDKNGNSLIQIKGTVGTDNEEMRICDSAVTIGLFYNNSSQNYARLSEGMNLLTAPKAESSWFRPSYGWYNEETDEGADNMGWEICVDKVVYEYDEFGTPYPIVEQTESGEWIYATEPVAIYGLYKSGNNILYGQICEVFEYEYEHVISEEESVTLNIVDVRDMAEARLWIGTNAPAWDFGESAYLDFMTFEEAVKAIDSLNQKDERYCIELLRTVEIGNTAGNGKYSSLSLPSKANVVTICGNGNALVFAGNMSLKCNIVFEGVQLSPVKLVKNEVTPAEVNISAGNYALMWNHSNICFAYQEDGEWIHDYTTGVSFANITGSSKGSLFVIGDSCLSANNVTGFGKIGFTGEGENYGWILTEGNVQATEICFTDGAKAKLRVMGNVTVNAVYLEDDVDAQFRTFRGKSLKINGAQAKDAEGNLLTDENGKKLYDSVITFGDEDLQLYTYESGGTMKNAAGAKLVTGKYLDADDWEVYALTGYDEDGEIMSLFFDYTDAACTGLYLGKEAQ